MGEIPGVSFKGKVDEILLSFGRMADGGGGKVEAFLSSWLFLHQTFGSNMLPCFFWGGKMMKAFWFHMFRMFGNCSLYLPNQLLVEINHENDKKIRRGNTRPTNQSVIKESRNTTPQKLYTCTKCGKTFSVVSTRSLRWKSGCHIWLLKWRWGHHLNKILFVFFLGDQLAKGFGGSSP